MNTLRRLFSGAVALFLLAPAQAGTPQQAVLPYNGVVFTVTVGGTAPTLGFQDGVRGAITPTAPVALGTVLAAQTTGARDFAFTLNGSLPQTLWRYLIVEDSGDPAGIRIFHSSAATYTTGATTSWQFGVGSSPVWTGTGTKKLIVYF